MKKTQKAGGFSRRFQLFSARAFLSGGLLLFAFSGRAQLDPGNGGTNSTPTYQALETWTFQDNTNWTSDHGSVPISFTNLDYSYLGDGSSLIVNSTDPAWLNFNVVETNGATNLTVDVGTVMFWFAPGSWSSTNAGGIGPGQFSRLFEVGSYTADSSYGWWSVYVDEGGNNIFFSAQTNDLSSNLVTYVSAPISWTTNYFHHIALTYSATNTALYLDGSLATNGPPLTVFPGADVLARGFFIGSDSNGLNQASGLFNNLAAYNVPMDADTIGSIFKGQYEWYMMNPWNMIMFKLTPSDPAAAYLQTPSSSPSYFNVISGAGYLSWLGSAANCFTSSNVWLTNVSATATSQPMTFNFSIVGGSPAYMYDVFATPGLAAPITQGVWTWMGQGATCNRYSLASLPTTGGVFFILGTAQDYDGDGLTDAYEKLVSHSDPTKMDTDLNGMPDGWQALHFNGQIGNNPLSDPDQDGLTNYKEYLYGSDPQVKDEFVIWVSSVN